MRMETLSHWSHPNGISAANMNKRAVNETIIIWDSKLLNLVWMVCMHSSLSSKSSWNIEMKSLRIRMLCNDIYESGIILVHCRCQSFHFSIYSVWMSIYIESYTFQIYSISNMIHSNEKFPFFFSNRKKNIWNWKSFIFISNFMEMFEIKNLVSITIWTFYSTRMSILVASLNIEM